jgi:hypothetical protein
MAQSFDERRLKLNGDPHPVAENIELFGESGPTGYGAFSASLDGILSYRAGVSSIVEFTWVDRTSRKLAPIGVPALYSEPCFSPDEKPQRASVT